MQWSHIGLCPHYTLALKKYRAYGTHNETAQRSPKGQVLLVLWWGFAECGNRKALRLREQGVSSCK